MALTLAGPRLWILIKASTNWLYFWYIRFRSANALIQAGPRRGEILSLANLPQSDDFPYPLPHQDARFQYRYRSNAAIINTTASSHSELGAARDLVLQVWNDLRAHPIELPSAYVPQTWYHRMRADIFSAVLRIWRNFLAQALDFFISLALSAFLIMIFIAESSGIILSANIISDSIALSRSSNCSIPFGDAYHSVTSQLARDYSATCYHASDATAQDNRCNHFYTQSIAYTEQSNTSCPFNRVKCLQGSQSAYTLDTGFVDAKIIGFNAAENYQFRRRMTCVPIDINFHHLTPGVIELGECGLVYNYTPLYNGLNYGYVKDSRYSDSLTCKKYTARWKLILILRILVFLVFKRKPVLQLWILPSFLPTYPAAISSALTGSRH